MSIKLGDEVRDRVTGFQGIIIARYQYLTGCERMEVQPPIDKDGKMCAGVVFDIAMLELITADRVASAVQEDLPDPPGGPKDYKPISRR